ncbi:transmembrane protein, putative [Bodo saltans]|uniref:Transmembrane protein, putative n=1 Tax=Bodo saltans TaxID=75058 RepID=A0A0S4JBJ3_BODSA|nr:transmembrane protein, putative [Bodo saltans]|eukprot:CUG86803.1 transmembrane protein, putative [Bodo saltans]
MEHLRKWVDPSTWFPGALEQSEDSEARAVYERRRRKHDRNVAHQKGSKFEPSVQIHSSVQLVASLEGLNITTTAPTPTSRSEGYFNSNRPLFPSQILDQSGEVLPSPTSKGEEGCSGIDSERDDDSDESSGPDTMDPRIQRRIEHFQRIPRLVPDMEFFFRYALCVMMHCLLGALCTPLSIVLHPLRVSRKDVMTIYFIAVGIVTFYLVGYPDSSVLYSTLYHSVRTAATIKLYLLFSILEVSDRLLTSVTSDSLEIFYAVSGGLIERLKRRKRRRGNHAPSARNPAPPTATVGIAIASFVISTVTVALHSMVLLLHVVALNVAINSEGNSILALVISNNFFEIKTVIFKKFVRESLFQVYCADALERIQLVVFLCCVILQHFNTDGSGTLEITDVLTVVASELLVDFLKHYFVATFNGVSLSLYRSYHQVLMFDVAADHLLWRLGEKVPLTCEDSSVDESTLYRLISPSKTFIPSASRRFGFVPMPYLAVLLWCVFPVLLDMWQRGRAIAILLCFCVLLGLRSLVHTYLVGNAARFAVRSLLISVPSPTSRDESGLSSTTTAVDHSLSSSTRV